jgi:uncharacterized Rmd1/YagE family protein
MEAQNLNQDPAKVVFQGSIFLLHAFDVGDDITLDAVERDRAITKVPSQVSKYFKGYHNPLAVELPHPHATSHLVSCKLHRFGAISLLYKIPFHDTLDALHKYFSETVYNYYEQSVEDARTIFHKIAPYTKQANFFQMNSLYTVIQLNPQDQVAPSYLRQHFGSLIATMMRLEQDRLSEFKTNEIWDGALGYFRENVILVDQEVSFLYEDEYSDILDVFEFANVQQVELKYFDKQLDQQLNKIYEHKIVRLPIRAYLPFLGNVFFDPVGYLGRLRAEISVITERLEHSIKLANEPYLSELYGRLVKRLEIAQWQEAIEKKLEIIRDVQTVYQHKIDATREDMLSVLVIILIFIEVVIGVLRLH